MGDSVRDIRCCLLASVLAAWDGASHHIRNLDSDRLSGDHNHDCRFNYPSKA
jgi:hypothetical protein